MRQVADSRSVQSMQKQAELLDKLRRRGFLVFRALEDVSLQDFRLGAWVYMFLHFIDLNAVLVRVQGCSRGKALGVKGFWAFGGFGLRVQDREGCNSS